MIHISILLLSFIIGIIITIGLLVQNRYNKNYTDIISNSMKMPYITKKTIVIFILVLIPIEVYILSNIQENFLQYIMLLSGFLLLSFTGYIYTHSKIGTMLGPAYVFLYLYYWNIYTFNIIAALLVIGVLLFLNLCLRWNNIKLIASLILIADFFLVYITKDMISFAQKVMLFELPNMIIIYTKIDSVFLGLGDILLAGLLCLKISEVKDYSMKKTKFLIWIMCLFTYPLFVCIKIFLASSAPATFVVVTAFTFSYVLINAPEYLQKIKYDRERARCIGDNLYTKPP